jgi:hypothetical protein
VRAKASKFLGAAKERTKKQQLSAFILCVGLKVQVHRAVKRERP